MERDRWSRDCVHVDFAIVLGESKMASKDMKAERATSKLDLIQLTRIIDGGEDVTRRRRRMGKSFTYCFAATVLCSSS